MYRSRCTYVEDIDMKYKDHNLVYTYVNNK